MSLIVYKSSAGSGKTFTLVKEYLKIAIAKCYSGGIKSILAMTFTNKAAGEMKERIIASLSEISETESRKSSDMFRVLTEELKDEFSEEEIIKRCDALLLQTLYQYSSFSISTIDKFNHNIIRSFALDLGLNQNFEVLLDAEKLLREAIENLISQVGKNPIMTRFLTEFAMERIADDKSWRIENELYDFSKFILYENSQDFLKPLSELNMTDLIQVQKEAKSSANIFESEVEKIAKLALALIDEKGIEYNSFLYGNSGGVPSYFKKRSDLKRLKKLIELKNISSRTTNAIENGAWYSEKKKGPEGDKIDAISVELTECYQRIEKLVDAQFEKYAISKGILRNFYATTLINEIFREFETLKERYNVLPISDFNKLIAKVVREQEAPYVYERVGNHFRHFLIDEFQDTSRFQWHNMLPLVVNSLSEGNENLVVGDGKQAIYRWRGGEVEQFIDLPFTKDLDSKSTTFQNLQQVKHHLDERWLDTNYRSKTNIVSFNNSLFDLIVEGKNDLIKQIFAKQSQQTLPSKQGGYVQVDVFNEAEKDQESFDEYNLRKTREAILGAISRGYQYSDIAILCRRNLDLINIVDYLGEQEEEFPLISSEALLIFKSEKVRLLFTYIKLILSPTDVHEQLRLMYLLAKVHGLKKDLHLESQSIKANTSLDNFSLVMNSLGFSVTLDDEVPYNQYEYLERGVEELGLNIVPDSRMLAFLNTCHRLINQKELNLQELVQELEEQKEKLSLSVPDNLNAIQLMTIHRAKGLEFPVVIYPFADYSFKYVKRMWLKLDGEHYNLPSFLFNVNESLKHTKFKDEVELEENHSLLDELNVLYVALTRAVDELYVFTSNIKRKTLNRYLLPALKQMDGWQNDFQFASGERKTISTQAEDKQEISTSSLESMYANPSRDNFHFIPPEISNNQEIQKAKEIGNWVHHLLAQNPRSENLESLVNQIAVKNRLTNSEVNSLKVTINGLLNNESIQAFFKDEEAMNEQEFITSEGELFRPDKIGRIGSKRYVLDYKTGEPDIKHHDQVSNYKALLSDFFEEEVEGYLLYVDSCKLLKVG